MMIPFEVAMHGATHRDPIIDDMILALWDVYYLHKEGNAESTRMYLDNLVEWLDEIRAEEEIV